MLHLVQVIDQALGYVAPSPLTQTSSSSSDPHSDSHSHSHTDTHSTLSPHPALAARYSSQTVQEKYVDHPAEYAAWERERWQQEGEQAVERANKEERERAGGTKDWREVRGEQEEGMEGIERGGEAG